jgi:hypothetical protein
LTFASDPETGEVSVGVNLMDPLLPCQLFLN